MAGTNVGHHTQIKQTHPLTWLVQTMNEHIINTSYQKLPLGRTHTQLGHTSRTHGTNYGHTLTFLVYTNHGDTPTTWLVQNHERTQKSPNIL